MFNKVSVKITVVLILVMMIIMTVFTLYFVRSRTKEMEQELLIRGRIAALTGAKLMQEVLEDAAANGLFTLDDIFDDHYQPIPNTNPQKYHTSYDTYLDSYIMHFEDVYLKDDQVVFAVLVDRNGYLPT